MKDAPCIVFALAMHNGPADSVIPAVQNLMLAARALGIGSVLTTLHPDVLERVYALLGVPAEAEFHHCIPLGYPRGAFGPTQRRPTAETTFWNRWDAPPPWG
jgi:nitroreductase